MAQLPAIPTGNELEHFVAALFQSSRFFVEKNVVEPDVCELDAVVTSYERTPEESILVEVKSGKWRVYDVFNTLGRMTYLGLGKAIFVVATSPERRDFDFVKQKMAQSCVRLIKIDEIDKADEIFAREGFPRLDDRLIFSVWRFSYWMETKLLDVLRAARKTFPDRRGPREALEYYSLVNNTVFFVKDKLERILELYKAYQTHPRVTLAVAAEMAGKEYDPENADPDNQFMREALWNGKCYVLQASMYVEHRARLTILKSAIDYLCAKQAGSVE